MNISFGSGSPRHLRRLQAIAKHCFRKDMAESSSTRSTSSTATTGSGNDNVPPSQSEASRSSPKRSYCQTLDGQSTAGIIVIGDEILKGQTLDTNSHFICKKLFSFGVKVQKISVIPDELSVIAQEVASFSERFSYVITSGGIGPTHDDMTFEGVAQAFGLKTEPHPELVQLISDWFRTTDMDSAEMKMAKIPQTAKLTFGIDPKTKQKSKYPLVSVRNVYIFPGVPNLLERAFVMLGYLFQNPDIVFHTDELYVNKDEASIAASISEVADKFKDSVVIGSYPTMTNGYYKVKLTFESTNGNSLEEARKNLAGLMPSGTVVDYDKDPITTSSSKVYSLIQDPSSMDHYTTHVRHAVSVLERALEMYPLSDICIGFNGGKDCTALLHLWYAVVKKKYPDYNDKLQALYIRSRCPFPEVEKFVQISRDRYNLEMIHYDGRIKESLGTLKANHPNMKAVIMGTRSTDPYATDKTKSIKSVPELRRKEGKLEDFTMTDTDWPQFMRVNPMLNWHYKHVWQFVRQLSLPYCSLYDRGYTSLGSMDNTHPNPLLQYIDDRGVLTYKPAYLLDNGEHERDGRNK